jgi:hypothetical protein
MVNELCKHWEVVATDAFPQSATDAKLDFLLDKPPSGVHVIVTNPPWSLRDAFLSRALELGMPWVFLLPADCITTQHRAAMLRGYPDMHIWFEPSSVMFRSNGVDKKTARAVMWIGAYLSRLQNARGTPTARGFTIL